MEYRDTWVVWSTNEAEGSGEPQATAMQLSHGETLHKTEKCHRPGSQGLDSHTRQESLDKVRKGFAKLRLVVNKVELPASSAAPSSRQEPSPKRLAQRDKERAFHCMRCKESQEYC